MRSQEGKCISSSKPFPHNRMILGQSQYLEQGQPAFSIKRYELSLMVFKKHI